MSALVTRIETHAGRTLAPEEIFAINRAREVSLSRLLMLYVVTGLVFMLLPGTFLGVWNLFSISSQHMVGSVPAGWIQAHGHAQIFGWIGTFILGIGFYSIPKLRRADPFTMGTAWLCWGLWVAGVSLRWATMIYHWHWRAMLPFSAALELVAFLLFFRAVSGHRPKDARSQKLEPWVLTVMVASAGLLLALIVNLATTVMLSFRNGAPEFPSELNQRFLVLITWGSLVPFVWGFSAKWLPIFLGLRPVRGPALIFAVTLNIAGVFAALAGKVLVAAILVAGAIVAAVVALRLFERAQRPAKVLGVHASFPFFVRGSYVWAIIAATLGIWAASLQDAQGVWGASRHALTVGFLATMVLSIGQRVLPAFVRMRLLRSTMLMFLSLVMLTAGCFIRVGSEILSYQGFAQWAWDWLPVSAILEMTAVTIFAVNLSWTFLSQPATPEA